MAFRKKRIFRKRGRRPLAKKVRQTRSQKHFKGHRRHFGPKHIRVKSDGITVSFDQVILRANKFGNAMRKKYWVGSKNVYNQQSSNFISLLANGSQGMAQIQYFNCADMISVLNTFGQMTSSGTVVGTLSNTGRIFWNKIIAETLFTNSSNGNLELDIYTFTTKKDTTDSPALAWTDGLYDETAQTLTNYTAQYGTSPLDSVQLTTFYKCIKVTHISLTPGQSHKHEYVQHLCMPVSNEYLATSFQASTVINYLRGIACVDLVVARGMPISSSTAGSSGVTSAAFNLNYITTKRYEAKWLVDNDTNYKFTVLGSNTGSGGNVYNQGSGASAASVGI